MASKERLDWDSRQYQNSSLLSQSFVREDEGRHDHFIGLCVFYIVLTFWVCLANASQVINVIFSPGLRRHPRNLLICNVCLTELVMGVFLCPLYTDTLMQGTWRHDVTTCAVYELIFYCQACVSTLSVLVAAVERLYFLLTPSMMEGSGRRSITAVLLALPWAIGAAFVTPIYKFGAIARYSEILNDCQVLWKWKFQSVTVFVSFFIPAFLLLCVVTALFIAHFVLDAYAKRRDLGPHPDREAIKESLMVVLSSSLVCVLLQFPFFVALVSAMLCQPGGGAVSSACGGPTETTWLVVMALLVVKPGVTPVTWMLYSDIRQGFTLGLGGACQLPVVGNVAVDDDDESATRDMADSGDHNNQTPYGVAGSQQEILSTTTM